MNQNYFAVSVQAKQAAIEAVEFALSEAGAEGTELDLLGKPKDAATVLIVGYFPVEPIRQNVEDWLADGLQIYELTDDMIENVDFRKVENRDWLAEWKKHWTPTETAKFIVAPTWSKIENSTDKIVLRIEPGMAFGTGTHETTKLCLKAIEENYRGESFFDVGTGTGVLAMAAAKIKLEVGSQDAGEVRTESTDDCVLACDTDADSVRIAEENARLNSVADKIEFYVGSISARSPDFDFVCANLTADVIVPILPLLIEKTRQTLILSGILREQQNWVGAQLQELQVVNFNIETQGEWISIVARKDQR